VQVEIELSVPLYALFPLISVLASELAEGVVLMPSQVEIVGANAGERSRDSSVVDANLLPLDQEFDNITAFLIFQRLWNHEVPLNSSLFGNYTVVYVHYPGNEQTHRICFPASDREKKEGKKNLFFCFVRILHRLIWASSIRNEGYGWFSRSSGFATEWCYW
jgi:hypothetical protein